MKKKRKMRNEPQAYKLHEWQKEVSEGPLEVNTLQLKETAEMNTKPDAGDILFL